MKQLLIVACGILLVLLPNCKKEQGPQVNDGLSIKILSPLDGDSIWNNVSTPVLIEATNDTGTVKVVNLYADYDHIQFIKNPPFESRITAGYYDSGGTVIITAIAEDDGGGKDTAEVECIIKDYKEPYLGAYSFKTIKRNNCFEPPIVDTIYHEGVVRSFIYDDNNIDLYPGIPSWTPSFRKVTVEFSPDQVTTPDVDEDGSMPMIFKSYYIREGSFIGTDSVSIYVRQGGQGANTTYSIRGKKKE